MGNLIDHSLSSALTVSRRPEVTDFRQNLNLRPGAANPVRDSEYFDRIEPFPI